MDQVLQELDPDVRRGKNESLRDDVIKFGQQGGAEEGRGQGVGVPPHQADHHPRWQD